MTDMLMRQSHQDFIRLMSRIRTELRDRRDQSFRIQGLLNLLHQERQLIEAEIRHVDSQSDAKEQTDG